MFSACYIVAKAKLVQKKMWSCAKIVAKQFTWPDSRLQGQTLLKAQTEGGPLLTFLK
jgi:hypothetical protein